MISQTNDFPNSFFCMLCQLKNCDELNAVETLQSLSASEIPKEESKENNKNSRNIQTPKTVDECIEIIKKTTYKVDKSASKRQIKGPWQVQEDEKLTNLVDKYGLKSWSRDIAPRIPGRNGKQCRERWYNKLSPLIKKDPWTPEEDNLLIILHKKYGNRWAALSKHLVGRSCNSIKNRWNSKHSRKSKKAQAQLPKLSALSIQSIIY